MPEIGRSEQAIQNWSFDEDYKVLAVEPLEFNPAGTGTLDRKVTGNLEVMVDAGDANGVYVGEAGAGSALGSAVWRIMKIIKSGTTTSVKYADNSTSFNKEWDERANYTYTT